MLGPNGAGKSTLLKILAGIEKPDEGEVVWRQGVTVAYIPQISSYPAEPLDKLLLNEAISHDNPALWVATTLSKLGFTDAGQLASTLSGGWKKRFDLARALVTEPTVLLLDEPTNHLDLETITWLEGMLQRLLQSYIVISHDRLFLERVTNRMIELNKAFPKGLFMSDGNYASFLERRAEFLLHRAQYEQGLRSKVRTEVAWLKRSPAARTTKQQARQGQAERLQAELSAIQATKRRPEKKWLFEEGGLMSRQLLVARNITKAQGEKTLFSHLNISLGPGSRLGIAGDNGSGKTTLLRILAGELTPDEGTVKYAEGLKIAYFDQHRDQLPAQLTLKECLAPNGDSVTHRGKEIHVHGWARRFHFQQERLGIPICALSGGERARLLLARLMLKPVDLLLLDEPTNDLDIETLELLEESIEEFAGAVVLVTHDRRMLENVCERILGLGCDTVEPYFADIMQWERARSPLREETTKNKAPSPSQPPAKEHKAKTRLTYRDEQELAALPERLEAAEAAVAALNDKIAQATAAELQALCHELESAQRQVDALYTRWDDLEQLKKASKP